MPNDDNKIILEFPATNVEIELGETITFDNISGFLDSERVTYNGDSLTEIITHLENDKADTTYVNTELAKKADKTDTYTKTQVDTALNGKADKSTTYTKTQVDSEISRLDGKIDTKANASDVYTKSQTDTLLYGKANASDVYTKQATDALLNDKADVTDLPDMSQYYDKSEVDDLLDDKANSDDVYGKAYIDTALSGKANVGTSYTKSEEDALLANKADKSDTYTKAQVDDIVYGILPDDTASGSVANFTTSLELPIKSLDVDVNAVQESGTPTPATPLPISGWSAISLVKAGANLWDMEWEEGAISNTTGLDYSSTNYWRTVGLIPIKPNTEYYICSPTGVSGNSIGFRFYGADKSYVGYTVKSGYGAINRSFVSPDNAYFLRFNPTNANCPNHDISLNYPSADTTYHNAYNGTTEVISLGGTYYGGHLTQDKAGHRQFEVTHNYIASYNGETINVPWISSMDVYSQGATPTTGAQVVYPLATPYVIDLPDGEPIITLNGTNNIYADTGDTSVVFKDSVNGYVEKKIASVQALALNT